jgi:hypothetical protein
MLAAAAVGQTASAQPPGSPLDGPFPPAGPYGPAAAPAPVGGYAANPTYTPVAPDASSPAGLPPGMTPWPAISPYENAYDSTYNDNGIWFREILGQSRRYHVSADFISGRFANPGHGVVGADVIRALPTSTMLGNEALIQLPPQTFYGAKDYVFRQSYGRFFANPGGNGTGGTGGTTTTGQNLGFPPRPVTTFLFDTANPPGGSGSNTGTGTGGTGGTGTNNGSNTQSIDFTFTKSVGGLAPTVLGGLSPISTTTNNGTGGTTTGSPTNAGISGTQLYAVTGSVLGGGALTNFGGDPNVVGEKRQNPNSPGIRMVFGAEDEDQSGFDVTGFWLSGQDQTFRRGLDDPNRPRLTNVVLFESSMPRNDANSPAYEVLDYNQLFEIKNDTTATGTDLALYHTPVVDYGWLVVRPLYGARYNYVRETFNFTGRDNGLFTVYNNDGSPVVGSVYLQNAAFTDPDVVPYSLFPYETSVTSRTQSHLYGPQVGLDAHMGGEHFMVISSAKTGVLVNTEKLTVDGYGFGLQEAFTGVRSFFGDSKTHTIASPFIEFSANAELNIFPVIPYLNRMDFFRAARLHGGWNALVVGNMQRPINQIAWRSESVGGPQVREHGRDAWYVQYWNVGLDWKF